MCKRYKNFDINFFKAGDHKALLLYIKIELVMID